MLEALKCRRHVKPTDRFNRKHFQARPGAIPIRQVFNDEHTSRAIPGKGAESERRGAQEQTLNHRPRSGGHRGHWLDTATSGKGAESEPGCIHSQTLNHSFHSGGHRGQWQPGGTPWARAGFKRGDANAYSSLGFSSPLEKGGGGGLP